MINHTWARRWRRWRARQQPAASQIVDAPDYRIEDGVDYRRPPAVPGSIRARGADAVRAYLREAERYYQGPFDAPYRSAADMPALLPLDDPLAEWDYGTRRAVLENCHAAYHRNPVAKRAVDLTRQFAVGKGHAVTAQNEQVQAVLDEFRANPENHVSGYERTFIQDLQIDGEIFVRFFVDDEIGQVVIVPIPPWQVRVIHTEPGFFRRVLSYELEYSTSGSDWVQESVPAAALLHVAINQHSYELRGRPDLFVILPWLKAYKDWIEDRARQNKWRGALLWWVKVAGAAPGVIAQKVAQWKRPPTPGSAYVSSDKEEVQALTNPVGANDASEDGRQIRLMSAIGMGLAEYMLGDGENANLATAQAQQLPALWKFTDAQELLKEQVWTPIYRRVIQAAVLAGRLPERVRVEDAEGDPVQRGGVDQWIAPDQAFSVEYYDVQAGDPKTVAEALEIDLRGGLVSIETARGKRGYDHAAEVKRLAREKT
jgi:hypothetical protein